MNSRRGFFGALLGAFAALFVKRAAPLDTFDACEYEFKDYSCVIVVERTGDPEQPFLLRRRVP